MDKRNGIICVVLLVLVTCMFSSCGRNNVVEKEAQAEVQGIGVDGDNPLLKYFKEKYPDNEVVLCGEEDVNNDGVKDLVVIYKADKKKKAMRVVIGKEEGYEVTNEMPAPMENQTIKFKNIDDKDQIEFIVSGSKNGQVGYGIYRLEDMEIIDLFGNGMEDCC